MSLCACCNPPSLSKFHPSASYGDTYVCYLKRINSCKIWKEWQNILNLQQITLVQKFHGPTIINKKKGDLLFDVGLFNNVSGNLQPQFFSKSIVILGFICINFCKFQIHFQGQINSFLIQRHGTVNENTSSCFVLFGTQTKCIFFIKMSLRLLLTKNKQNEALH